MTAPTESMQLRHRISLVIEDQRNFSHNLVAHSIYYDEGGQLFIRFFRFLEKPVCQDRSKKIKKEACQKLLFSDRHMPVAPPCP